jgi:acyl carrier protein
MGLDLVEFAMAIEAEFELTIPDAEAAKLLTLGDIAAALEGCG